MMRVFLMLLLAASSVDAAGKIPMAFITADGSGGFGACTEGLNCYYDTHPPTPKINLWTPLIMLAAALMVSYGAYTMVKPGLSKLIGGGRCNGHIRP